MKKRSLYLLILILITNTLLVASHWIDTPVTTHRGCVTINTIELKDKVIGFNDKASSVQETLLESSVHQLHYFLCDSFYIISLEKEDLCVSDEQKFYDVVTGDWVKAKNLTHESVLVDIHGKLHPCMDIMRCNDPCEMYDLSIDAPHFYFTGKSQILTHNVPPVILTWPAAIALKKAAVYSVLLGASLWKCYQHSKELRRPRPSVREDKPQEKNKAEKKSKKQRKKERKQEKKRRKEAQKQPPPSPERKECLYKDVTKPRSKPNVETDVTREEFEKELKDDKWEEVPSKDGKAISYKKDGAEYVVRDNAKSTGGPTADYYKPNSDNIDLKIRLLTRRI